MNTNPQLPSSAVERSLERLEAVQCTDPGVFVLSVHSFVEGWIRERFNYEMEDVPFWKLMDQFVGYVKKKNGGLVNGLSSMSAMVTAHNDTNGVRHRFAELDRRAAESATSQLERFCFLANVGSPERIGAIKRYLALWDERKPLGALIEENRSYKELRGRDAEEKRQMVARIDQMTAAQKAVEVLEASLAAKDRRIEELEVIKDAKAAKADAERKERGAIAEELRKAQKMLDEYERERRYVELARRLTVFTRTRADYERAIVKLTPEQTTVLDQISLKGDFLVKGGAGTGKTLVLLKAIEKAKGSGTFAEMGMAEAGGSVALLTYNSTLVKYDRYLAGIMSPESGADRIMTADSFIQERLKAIDPGAQMDYDIIKSLSEKYCVEGLSKKEVSDEAEVIVWGNDLSYEAYVEGGFERWGMKRPMSKADRARMWTACEAMAAEMEAVRRYSKGYSRVKLLHAAEADPSDERIRCVDYLFIDEAQDLAAADLKALKSCSRRCAILAGDADQSIYQPGFSFRQAGMDIVGHTRILRSNFRNTLPIHSLAEAFRAKLPGGDLETKPAAFREGPLPEHFSAPKRDGLLDLLVSRVSFFLRYLDYAPENLCVIAPMNDEVDLVIEALSGAGIAASKLDKSFEFRTEGTVRVSTFHSAKGLDFPVVMLLLNRKPFAGAGYDEASVDRMTRDLIYVGMTRAMDHLNIFTLDEPGSHAIADLVACFDAQEAAGE